MLKLKKVLVPVIALGLVFSGISYKIISVKAAGNGATNSTHVVTAGETHKLTIANKPELHKGIQDTKANTPYKIKTPTVKMDDLKLVDMNSDKHPGQGKDIHIAYSIYKSDDGNKDLVIQQADTTEKNPLTDQSSEQIKLNDGTKAWIYDPSNGLGYIHVIFIKDGQTFDVMGSNLGKNRIIDIANSLN
ncbi:MAG: hypothetical protein Q8936_10835 [Bacillota bacterium]|nr:hypothetical protein [Bacillota bacterium]